MRPSPALTIAAPEPRHPLDDRRAGGTADPLGRGFAHRRVERARLSAEGSGRADRFRQPARRFLSTRADPFCIPRGARNPDLAKAFINFSCTVAPQQANGREAFYASPNKKVVYFAGLAKRVVVSTPEELARAVPENYEAIVDNLPEKRRRAGMRGSRAERRSSMALRTGRRSSGGGSFPHLRPLCP